MKTLGEFKKALRDNPYVPLFVWVNWQRDEGDYIWVSRSRFLNGIDADIKRNDSTPIDFRVDETGIYVC